MMSCFSLSAFFADYVASQSGKQSSTVAAGIWQGQPTLCGPGPLQGLAGGIAPSTPQNAKGRVTP